MSERSGTVVAVSLSPEGGIPKYPRQSIVVGLQGVEGDYHAGATRISHRTGETVPNDRPVSLVAQEVYDTINAELGIGIPPGGFGENITTQGLGDLSELGPGDQLHFSSGVVLQVTEQNTPCSNLSIWHRLVPKLAFGRRGIVCTVISSGQLQPGDEVWVVRADSPAVPG